MGLCLLRSPFEFGGGWESLYGEVPIWVGGGGGQVNSLNMSRYWSQDPPPNYEQNHRETLPKKLLSRNLEIDTLDLDLDQHIVEFSL